MTIAFARRPLHLCSLEGPLPAVGMGGDAPGHFADDPAAQGYYSAHRSEKAPADTRTFHALSPTGAVTGFISWRLVTEDHADLRLMFVSVEYIYVARDHRRCGVAGMLLNPLILEVQSEIANAKSEGSFSTVRICSTSNSISGGGNAVLRGLEQQLARLARSFPGLELIGRRMEHPPGATLRLWATTKPANDSEAWP